MDMPSDAPGYAPPLLNPSIPGMSNVVVFSPYERKGVIVMAVAGVFSCSLVSILLLYIAASAILSRQQRNMHDAPTPFIRKQVAVFVLCLLFSDLIQSISGILQVKWAAENRIYEGPACTLQAATLVMGDLGSTIWSCVIAIHTFSGLALGKQWSRLTVVLTVITGWSINFVLTIIGPTTLEEHTKGPFYGIAGEWCFITSSYPIHRLIIHYVPLFLAAVVIVVFYGLLFLVLRGSISFTSNRIIPSSMRMDDNFLRERIMIAKRMLWYPIAYLTCIFPIAIIRLVGLRKHTDTPTGVWIFAMFFLFSLGSVDSVIYATTRNVVKPIRRIPVHMGTVNSTDGTPLNSPGKSEFGGDVPEIRVNRWDSKEQPQKVGDDADYFGEEDEMKTGVAAIRVTEERIEKII